MKKMEFTISFSFFLGLVFLWMSGFNPARNPLWGKPKFAKFNDFLYGFLVKMNPDYFQKECTPPCRTWVWYRAAYWFIQATSSSDDTKSEIHARYIFAFHGFACFFCCMIAIVFSEIDDVDWMNDETIER